MEAREALRTLRERHNLTQDQLAERVMVTRQAVSRWETGETQPNTDTLRLLSREFDVSINTLLGAPRQLFCQCCGMPLTEDGSISREPDGAFNEDYCKWCYADGKFVYTSKEALIDNARRYYSAYTMKYAVVFIASAPMLAAYPFVQKYFIKGVMVGAVKE